MNEAGVDEAPISATQRGIAAAAYSAGSAYIDHVSLERSAPTSLDRLTRALDEVALKAWGTSRIVRHGNGKSGVGRTERQAVVSQGPVGEVRTWSGVFRDWAAGEPSPRMIELRVQQLATGSRLAVVWHHAALDGIGIDLLLADLLCLLDGRRAVGTQRPTISSARCGRCRRWGCAPARLSAGMFVHTVTPKVPTDRGACAASRFQVLASEGFADPTAHICAALVWGVDQVAGVASAAVVRKRQGHPRERASRWQLCEPGCFADGEERAGFRGSPHRL